MGLLRELRFKDVAIRERFDCFRDTQVAERVSPEVAPHGVNVFARRPASA